MTLTERDQLVVDASAALTLASGVAGFSRLSRYQLIAPPLMWSEAFSVLRESAWHGAISHRLASETRDRLVSCPVRAQVSVQNLLRAWRVSEELGWAKTYDAEYVALARELGCPLVTVDARLQRGAGHLVEMVAPDDL